MGNQCPEVMQCFLGLGFSKAEMSAFMTHNTGCPSNEQLSGYLGLKQGCTRE